MKTKIILVMLFCAYAFMNAQSFEKPNYVSIQKKITDPKSEFYYPTLLKRLKANDTLMTHDQYKHLYYGYVFQPDFHPYKESDRVEDMKKYYRGDYKESDIAAGIKLFKEELEITPLDLKAMRQLAVMYSKNNDMPTAKKINKNYLAFVDTILTTGDGLKCETGFYVNNVPDEYTVLRAFEMKAKNSSLTSDKKCDYIDFEPGVYKIDRVYFDITSFYGNLTGLKD